MNPSMLLPPKQLGYLAFVALLLLAVGAVNSSAPATLPTQPIPFCQTNGPVHDLLYHQGVLYLAGAFTIVRPAGEPANSSRAVSRTGLAACDGATGAILEWQPQVTHTTPAEMIVHTLALAPDGGALYFGGQFTAVNNSARANAAAVRLQDGALLEWAPNPTRRVRDLLIDGNAQRVYSAGGNGVQAYTADTGNRVTSFNVQLLDANGGAASVYVLALALDGATLYFGGGTFITVNGVTRTGAAAVDADTGQTVLSFAPDLRDTNPVDPVVQLYDMYLYDRHLYLCGDWWITEGGVAAGGWGEENPNGRQANLGRFDPTTGAADRSWQPWSDGGIQGCDLDPLDQLFMIGGHFEKAGGATQSATDPLAALPKLAAFDLSNGNPVTPTWKPGIGAANFPATVFPELWAIMIAGGRLTLGGHFESSGSSQQQGVAPFELGRTALMVVDDPMNLVAGDRSVLDRLEQILGFGVRVVDDDTVSVEDAANVKLVAISATASSTKLGAMFKHVPAPVLVWKPWILDEMGMAPAPESEYGTLTGQQAQVIDTTHPLAAGRTGTIKLTLIADKTFSWGNPGVGAQVIATMLETTTNQQRPIFFAYPRHALLADGSAAAGCRIALPMYQNAAASYTMDAWIWFDAAVRWGIACPTALTTTPTSTPIAAMTPTLTPTPAMTLQRLFLPLTQR